MSATLRDLTQIQRDFDSRHGTVGRPWSKQIDDSNFPLLLELTVAMAGEVGEFANLTKKIARGDFTLESARPGLGSELADVLIYLLKLADQLGIDLEVAFRSKLEYNEQRFERFLIPRVE